MAWLDVLFPGSCLGCGVRGAPCCPGCRQWTQLPAAVAWPQPVVPGMPTPWAVATYEGVPRELLLSYKERGAVGLAPVLADALAASIMAALPANRRPMVLVPIPSSRRAVRERGDDVVLRLTRRAAASVRRRGACVHVVAALRHARPIADSAGLSARERRANRSGAFAVLPRCRRQLVGAHVVITDDLITTGATVAEAARILRHDGAVVMGAALVAATRRRGRVVELGASGLLGDGDNGATVT